MTMITDRLVRWSSRGTGNGAEAHPSPAVAMAGVELAEQNSESLAQIAAALGQAEA